jgi:hypothetical protein
MRERERERKSEREKDKGGIYLFYDKAAEAMAYQNERPILLQWVSI